MNAHKFQSVWAALVAAWVLFLGTFAQAQIVTVPSGLAPGSEYRLVFPTADGIYAWSGADPSAPTSIADYNTFATSEATAVADLSVLGTTWSAIVSTNGSGAVTAVANTLTGAGDPSAAIYNLAGQLVASGNSAPWSGSIQNPIDVTQLGGSVPDQSNGSGQYLVWTGATSSGGNNNDWSLVNPTGGYIYYGKADQTGTANHSSWISNLGGENGWDPNANKSSQMPIYVMSGILTVPYAYTATWSSSSGTTWGNALNWTGSGSLPPNGAGGKVIFGAANTVGTVDLVNTSRTVGAIEFQNNVPTTILSSGIGTLILDGSGSVAQVTLDPGMSHQISAPVQLAAGLNVAVSGSGDALDAQRSRQRHWPPEHGGPGHAGALRVEQL